ncbi:MAG: pyridoxal phosphate-dependent aminotransferase [Synergistaceae bacterium]|jgi:aspartate/methionine/tyrosine aminotransferase|nr:pyridoxal phosphate-dependent aminotransferase [Synergistaceae bacterium]
MKLADRYSKTQPSGMIKIFQAIEKMEDVLNLGIGEPDFDTEHDIIDAAAKAAKEGFTHYPPLQGFLDVRKTVCDYWKRRHGLDCAPEEVLMTAGGIQVPHLAMQAMLNPGDEVILVEPYFTPYFTQVEEKGGMALQVRTTEENGFAPTVDDLEKALTPRTKILLLNSPCNPTGRVIPRRQLEEIAALVTKRDLFVLSDEIYESLIYKGEHVSFATLPGMKERTLTMAGMSKSHCMTGWRVGYGIGPVELIRAMTVIATSQTYGLNAPAQKASAYALANHDHKLVERKKIFDERMDYVTKRLNGMKNVTCGSAEGAFYLFPNIKSTGLTSEAFVWKLLEDAHVATIPGSAFGVSGEGYLRIACTQSIEILIQAMDRMESFLAGLK